MISKRRCLPGGRDDLLTTSFIRNSFALMRASSSSEAKARRSALLKERKIGQETLAGQPLRKRRGYNRRSSVLHRV
jgi:hypothetical protein